MKRKFRITITPDDNVETYNRLPSWVRCYWNIDFMSEARFRGHKDKIGFYYCLGIELEVFDKTAKAL